VDSQLPNTDRHPRLSSDAPRVMVMNSGEVSVVKTCGGVLTFLGFQYDYPAWVISTDLVAKLQQENPSVDFIDD
jgi:hypothetical protein